MLSCTTCFAVVNLVYRRYCIETRTTLFYKIYVLVALLLWMCAACPSR